MAKFSNDINDMENEQDAGDQEIIDPEMQGLSLNDQKWYIVQKGHRQVKQFCDDIGLPQYYELFLQFKYTYGNKIRKITQNELRNAMKLTDPDEIEAILAHSGEIGRDEEIAGFNAKYGDPDQLIAECQQGLKFIEERKQMAWARWLDTAEDKPQTEDATQLTFEQKWAIPKEDFDNFSTCDGIWATASSCDGMVFLWPLDRPRENAPAAENAEQSVSYPGCCRAAYCHPMIATDYCFDFERMVSISCGGDCRVVFYDMEQNKIMSTIKNDKGVDAAQSFLSIDGDAAVGKVAIGTCNGPVKIGDQERGKVVQVLKGHTDDVYDVKANWDENIVVTGSWDNTLGMFDLRSQKRVRTMKGHTAVLNRIDVCFEQLLAMSFAAEQDFMMWDLKDGRCVKSIQGHKGGNNDGVVNWQTMEAVTGGEDGLVKFWDLQTGNCKRTFDCDHLQTLALDINWDKGLLMTGSWDYKVRIWDAQTGIKLHELKKARRTITQCHLMGGRGSR